jgi:hypothetical protein
MVLATAVALTIGEVQHAHVHLTQKAGHPLSGPDSLVPIAQVSAISSELMPLASAISNTSTAAKTTRRIQAILPHLRKDATEPLCAPRRDPTNHAQLHLNDRNAG